MKDNLGIKLAIHDSENSFSKYWIEYCNQNGIPFVIVNCYQNDIIDQLADCDALMWHFHHKSPRAIKFSKQLVFAIQASGKRVFPDFNTVWHFDDKVGQKYFLESLGLPFVPSYVFYSRTDALNWVQQTEYPKVFKLRNGSSSDNVYLVHGKKEASRLIKRAFGNGFKQYEALRNLQERYRKYRLGKVSFWELSKGVIRMVFPTEFSKTAGRERGYVYFQDFIPNNDHDIRIITIGDKALAIKRMVRKNDFRASGSGDLHYNPEFFSADVISLAFQVSSKIKAQCLAIDFIMNGTQPLIVEISYGFPPKNFIEGCKGYYDTNINWHEEDFNPYGWMVDNLIKEIKE